jgi:hypothetical protein
MDGITIATFCLVAVTLLLALVGVVQIFVIRKENKLERTLAACNRYESDAIIEGCVRRLREAQNRKEFEGKEKDFQQDIVMVLNYLDTIAIGVQQGLYDENLAWDHTEAIVRKWHDSLLTPDTARAADISLRDYDRLCKMAKRWANVEPRFRRGWRRRWWRST